MKTVRIVFTILFYGIFVNTLLGQNATIKGTVIDGAMDEPLPFASVVVQGVDKGMSTDFEGNYSFSLPKGTYNIIFSFVGYKPDTAEIILGEGETKTFDIILYDNNQLDQFVVEVEALKNENFYDEKIKEDTKVQEIVTADKASEKGQGDVGKMVKGGVSGVQSQGSSRIFVRGLGDRYNNATLNNLPVPSPNPDLKVIPLDLFPTDVVQIVAVTKAFDVEQYGDFAGATINILTKETSNEPFFNVNLGTGFYTNSLAAPEYKMMYGSQMENILGIETGNRNLPNEVADVKVYNTPEGENTKIPFSTNWAISNPFPINRDLSISAGKTWTLDSNNRSSKKLGVIASLSSDNKMKYQEGFYKIINKQGDAKVDYSFNKYTQSSNATALGGITYEHNKNNKWSFVTLYVNSNENEYAEYKGEHVDFEQIKTIRNTFKKNMIWVNQLMGQNKIMQDRLILDYGASYSIANSAEPDRKQLVFKEYTVGGETKYRLFGQDVAFNNRYWNSLEENEISGRLATTIQLTKDNNEFGEEFFRNKITIGLNTRMKKRDFFWRQLNYNIEANAINSFNTFLDVDENNPNNYLNQENYSNGIYELKEQVDASNEHTISQDIHAAYINADFQLIPKKLQIVAGLRAEIGTQKVTYKTLADNFNDPWRVKENKTNGISEVLLPALTLKYTINKNSKKDTTKSIDHILRFAASKTMSRPGFKEMSPFQYEEVFGGALVEGNPLLINGSNYNVDLKYEFYPSKGNKIGFGVFGKYLLNPIEKVAGSSSGTLFTYINSKYGMVYGAELELSSNLGTTFNTSKESLLNDFTIGLNAAYLYTKMQVTTQEDIDNAPIGDILKTLTITNFERQMQGASPIIVNADLSYKTSFGIKETIFKNNFAIVYSYNSEKLVAAGTEGLGDMFESAINTLDFVYKATIKEHWKIGVSVMNILDPTITRQQLATNVEGRTSLKIINTYQKGIQFGFSVGYKL